MKVRQDPALKPYGRCLKCTRFRTICGGIPTRGMDLSEWCEYMRDVKDMAHLTNAYIAQAAQTSVKTIERIMALNYDQDIMRATARRIEMVVIGAVGKHVCEMDYTDGTSAEVIDQLRAELVYWRSENERKSKMIDHLLSGPQQGNRDTPL